MKIFLLSCVTLIAIQGYVIGYNANIHMHGVSELLSDIVLQRFPKCGVIFVSDNHFQGLVVRWMEKILRPVLTLNLEQKAHPMLRGIAEDKGSSGPVICTTIIICCRSKSTCRTQNSQKLFEMLLGTGIIRSIRRSFLYIQNETTNTFKPTSFYEKENAVNYSMPLMNYAKEILREMKTHITLIRRFVGTSPLLRHDDSPTYHLITFTPNWLPGGSPVLQIIWSKNRGFWEAKGRSGGLKIGLNRIRPGTVQVALPNFHLLPLINIDEKGTATGSDATLMNLLTKKFGFKVEYFEAPDGDYGDELKSGKWTGVIGQVITKNADIGIGPMTFSPEKRRAGLQFSPYLVLLRGVIVCPIPPETHSWLILFTPFGIYVWISMLVTMGCVLALNTLLQKAMRRLFKPRKRWGEGWFPRRTKDRVELWFCWIHCIGPILQRSVPLTNLSRRDGFRIFIGFVLLFGFAISLFYGSVLMVKLSIYTEKSTFDNFEDLVTTGKDWVLSPLVEEALENTQIPNERKLLDDSFAIGVQRGASADQKEYKYALETGHCAVMEDTNAAYVIHNNYTIDNTNEPDRPLLRISKSTILLGPSGWVTRSDIDFILYNYLSKFFATYRDLGFIEKALRAYERQRDELQTSYLKEGEETGVRSLEMETVQMVFYCWIGGLLLGFLTFIFELSSFTVKAIEKKKSDRHNN